MNAPQQAQAVAETGPATTRPDKRFSTAQARVALWGGTLTSIDGDDGKFELIVTRWSLTKRFADLAALEQWLDQVDGRSA